MGKVIIYGMGQAFDTIMNKSNFIDKVAGIVAIVDKKKAKFITTYCWKNKEIPVFNHIDEVNETFDFIIITSDKFYDEISTELINAGIALDKLICMEKFLHRFAIEGASYKKLQRKGADIGGPSYIFRGIYEKAESCDIINYSPSNIWGELDEIYTLNGRNIGKTIIADATNLHNIDSETYDFVLSSNNLEHIANPIKAVLEWKRILKKEGLLVIAVPDRAFTFDHNRKVTDMLHLISDFEKDITEEDLNHVEEILQLHDLSMDEPAGSFENFKKRCYKNFENRCLHHHVFDETLLIEIANYVEMQILISGIIYCGNHIIILKK